MSCWAYNFRAVDNLSSVSNGGRPPVRPRARAAARAARRARRRAPSMDTVVAQVASKPRQGGENMEHQSTTRRRRIDIFLQRSELDTTSLQIGQLINKVPNRTTQPIQAPHHQGV